MKRFTSLFLQDLLLAYRSGHLLITAILLVVMLALVAFLPRQVDMHQELIYDATPGQVVNAFLAAHHAPAGMLFGDREAFEAALAAQPSKVGVVVSGSLAAPRVEVITQGTLAEENVHLLQASIDSVLAELQGTLPAAGAVAGAGVLREAPLLLHPATAPVPFNLMPVPIMLVFEVVLLGFFIVAVMVLQEKQEGTIRAYRVTPARTLVYIVAKDALFVALSLVYGGILLGAAFGGAIDYPAALAVLALGSSLMTLLSLAVSVFFRDLSEWFFVGVGILLVNSLPMASYMLPSFAPAWMTWLPSYPTVFAVRDILFHGAGLAEVAPALAYLLAGNLLAFIASYWAVQHRLMKGGH